MKPMFLKESRHDYGGRPTQTSFNPCSNKSMQYFVRLKCGQQYFFNNL